MNTIADNVLLLATPIDCADCGDEDCARIVWFGTSARCILCHRARMTDSAVPATPEERAEMRIRVLEDEAQRAIWSDFSRGVFGKTDDEATLEGVSDGAENDEDSGT